MTFTLPAILPDNASDLLHDVAERTGQEHRHLLRAAQGLPELNGAPPARYALIDRYLNDQPTFRAAASNRDAAITLLVELYRSDILDMREEGDMDEDEQEFDNFGAQGEMEAAYDIYSRRLDQRYVIVDLGDVTLAALNADPALLNVLAARPATF